MGVGSVKFISGGTQTMGIFVLEPGQDLAPRNVIIIRGPGRIILRGRRVIRFRRVMHMFPDKLVVQDLSGKILEIPKEEILEIREEV